MFNSLISPKRPKGAWLHVVNPNAGPLDAMGYPHVSWLHKETGLFAISAVEVMTPEEGELEIGPEYHLSISMSGQRCSTSDALFVLNAFDLLNAMEDNHVPSGRVRNFWMPVADRLSGYECPCTNAEPAMIEDKGDFVWRGITK